MVTPGIVPLRVVAQHRIDVTLTSNIYYIFPVGAIWYILHKHYVNICIHQSLRYAPWQDVSLPRCVYPPTPWDQVSYLLRCLSECHEERTRTLSQRSVRDWRDVLRCLVDRRWSVLTGEEGGTVEERGDLCSLTIISQTLKWRLWVQPPRHSLSQNHICDNRLISNGLTIFFKRLRPPGISSIF